MVAYLVIHGWIGEGYAVSSAWSQRDAAETAAQRFADPTLRWEKGATGMWERLCGRDAKREYVDVIPIDIQDGV